MNNEKIEINCNENKCSWEYPGKFNMLISPFWKMSENLWMLAYNDRFNKYNRYEMLKEKKKKKEKIKEDVKFPNGQPVYVVLSVRHHSKE